MRSARPNTSRREKVKLRSRVGRGLWKYGRYAGKSAWRWARSQPPIQRQIERAETQIESLRELAHERLVILERDFWAWIERLEAEGYIDSPRRSGPSLIVCYDLIGVSPQVTDEELKRAWRKQMMAYHPDRFAQDPKALQSAETKAREINEAYQTIKRIRGA